MFRSQVFNSFKHSHIVKPTPPSSGIHYIIDTDIGGDIDDSIALLLALKSQTKPLAITTTHIDPEEKSRIAKTIVTECGFPQIPVFTGIGSKRTESKKEFLKQNSLFPAVFGFPNPEAGEKKWYEKQGTAYRETYSEQYQTMKIETESASDIIVKTARKFSPDNKLTIIALGPLHNIAAALKCDANIANNIRLIAMGGVYPKGYNWLISPETSSFVLSQVETLCITSEFISKNNLCLSPEELSEIELSAQSNFGKTFISDWRNWHKGDALGKKATFLYDPVTLYLALHPEEIISSNKKQVTFPCLDSKGQLKPELQNSWYFKPGLEDKLILVEDSKKGNVTFVDQVKSSEKIKNEIFVAIKTSLSKVADQKNEKIGTTKPKNLHNSLTRI